LTLETLSEDEQRRIDAFLQLSRLERGLRAFLQEELSKVNGPNWVRALPKDIKEKIELRGVEYADFPDLKKILASNWRRLTGAVSQMKKEQILAHLEGLERVRNDIAHSRDVSDGALALVQAAYYVISPLFDESSQGKGFPLTDRPIIALTRLRGAISYSEPVASADLRCLLGAGDYRDVCQSIEDYERVRVRPGRDPGLMKRVQSEALDAVDNTIQSA